MKKYSILVIFLSLFILTILFISFKHQAETKNPINQFIQLILTNKEYELNNEEINHYIDVISEFKIDPNHFELLKKQNIDLAYLYYLLGEYDKSYTYFNESNQLKKVDDSVINLIELMGLAKVYMALGQDNLSYQSYQEALDYAKTINDEFVSITYQSYARTLVEFNKGTQPAIQLMKKALAYENNAQLNTTNHLYLGQLYLAQRNYNNATHYTNVALTLANENHLNNLKMQAIVQFAIIYYEEEKYNQAISLFREILKIYKTDLSITDKLSCLSYLADAYAMINQYDLSHTTIKLYKELVMQQSDIDINKPLCWISLLETKVYLLEKNSAAALSSLQKANDFYNLNPDTMYINTDLWMKQLALDIEVLNHGMSESLLEEYIQLFETCEQRGIKNILYSYMRNHLIKYSFELGRTDITLHYMGEKIKELTTNEAANFDSEISKIVSEINRTPFALEIAQLRKVLKLFILFAFILTGFIINLHIKKRRINQLNATLYEQSITDYLTQVYNKQYLFKYLNDLKSSKSEITCMLVDIDYFKRYNDTYGHVAGDLILKNVSHLLKEKFADDVVCRYGGEEFCIVSTDNLHQFILKVESLYETLHQIKLEHKASLVQDYITLSSGIHTDIISSNSNIESFLNRADQQLYAAKHSGRDCYKY